MKASVSQLILDFEPPVGSRDDDATLVIFHSEQEYFNARRFPVPDYKVKLPQPFQETVFIDSRGWRQKPQPAGLARHLGYRMWLNLPKEVQDSILAGSTSAPQRVAIMSTHCGMDGVPWEWLTDEGEEPIAVRDHVRFIRLVPTRYASAPLSVTPPVRVLIVVTNPKDERLLNPTVEIDVIAEGLRQNEGYKFDILMEPRFDKLKECLETFSPHVLHYVGHSGISGSMGNLILHDENEGTRWVSAAELSKILPSTVRLLCLSTCVTEENYDVGGLAKFAHCASEIQLPTVIANQYTLHENEARSFWRKFYPALLESNGNAVEAMHSARFAVCMEDKESWCWASFSMAVRDGSGHVFQIVEASEKAQERRNLELQAQWSARLANSLATRMRSLDDETQKAWEPTLDDEVARTESLQSELDNY